MFRPPALPVYPQERLDVRTAPGEPGAYGADNTHSREQKDPSQEEKAVSEGAVTNQAELATENPPEQNQGLLDGVQPDPSIPQTHLLISFLSLSPQGKASEALSNFQLVFQMK